MVKSNIESKLSRNPQHINQCDKDVWFYETKKGLQVYFDRSPFPTGILIPWSKILKSADRYLCAKEIVEMEKLYGIKSP